MERLTVDYGEKFKPFRYAMKDGSDAEVGYFKDYDAFYSHMMMVQKLGEYEDLEEQGLPIRWIPCSEQIPEEPEENPLFDGKYLEVYLVTTKYGSSEQDKAYPFRAFWNGINFTDGMNILDVIAWMPLPKPYRESEE